MKTESEINAEIRYAQGYLEGLRFALGKTDTEIKNVVVTPHQDNDRGRREVSRFWAPIGITAGLAILFFGTSKTQRSDIIAGAIMIGAGFILTFIYFSLLRQSPA